MGLLYKANDYTILEMIHTVCKSTLKNLLDIVYKYVGKFSNPDKNHVCQRNINVHHYHSIML